ncbi:thioredoxin, partial [Patescibacteria group bacterium]|nr:thioredoxin [Patescibacteria group bacterium]
MTLILTDENFEKEIQSIDKPVLVDFFATWCGPCTTLDPILEKIADDLKDEIVLVRVELDNIPITAQKFGIDRIPAVVLFRGGKPISGFIGLRTEEFIKEWLEKTIKQPEDNIQEKVEELNRWYANYAKENGFNLNPNKEMVQRLIRGLLENEK